MPTRCRSRILFFQAEDGIRDIGVTGVQTCALPIYWRRNKTLVLGAVERGGQIRLRIASNNRRGTVEKFLGDVVSDDAKAIYTDELRSYDRSEERRVGKECRWPSSPESCSDS